METSENTAPMRRSQADKIGKHKYEIKLLHRLESRLDHIEQMQRIIFQGLSGYFRFDRPLVEKVCCESDLDLDIVSAIYEAGPNGILNKKIISSFPKYRLEKHKILRIVNRVNKNSGNAFGKPIIEKRGKKYTFSDFGVEIWGKTSKEVEEDAKKGEIEAEVIRSVEESEEGKVF